jgi:hypothetical protein
MDHLLVHGVLEPRKVEARMNLYVTKMAAEVAASSKELEAARLSQDRRHSSGHRFRSYKAERRFGLFWRVAERKLV